MADMKKLLDVMNETTVSGSIAAGPAVGLGTQRRNQGVYSEETDDGTKAPAAPKAKEFGLWKNSVLAGAEQRDRKKSKKSIKENKSLDQSLMEGRFDNPVSNAITRRIIDQRSDLMRFGPSEVMSAIEQVAEWVGDVDEIGSSDVAGWVKQVEILLKTQNGQGMMEGQYQGQYSSKESAIQYAKDKVKSFRDWEDGIEVWAMPSGGFDVVHTSNSNGRNHVIDNGGKKLGTIYPEKPAFLKKKDVAESSVAADDVAGTLNSYGYYTKNAQDYVHDKTGDRFQRAGSQWKHQSGTKGRGPEELDSFLSSKQGVAEGSDDELNARPGMWRGNAKRMTAKGKPTKDELGMQDNLKNRIKSSNKKGGITGPKGPLPEEQGVAEAYDDSMTDAEWEREYQREKSEKEQARKEIEKNHVSQYKTKEEAIQYANDKLKTFKDSKIGMSVYAMPDGGFDVCSTARTAATEKRRKLISDAGGKHLGTLGPRYTKHKMAEGGKSPSPGWMLRQDPELAKKVKDSTAGYKDLKKYAGKPVPKKDDKGVAEGNDSSDIRPPRVGDEIVLKNSNYRGVIVKLGTDGEFSFKNESDGKRYRGNQVMIDRNLSQENRYKERSDTDNKRFDDAIARDMERINKSGALKKFGIGEEVEEGKTGPGLWANIRAKQKRIKSGSGERMRKPGSKGAPSNKDLTSTRAASKNESLEDLPRKPKENDPYEQGWRTFYRRGDESDNPYERGTEEYKQWLNGFQDGEAEPNHYDESVDVSENTNDKDIMPMYKWDKNKNEWVKKSEDEVQSTIARVGQLAKQNKKISKVNELEYGAGQRQLKLAEENISEEQLLAKELARRLTLFMKGQDHELGTKSKDRELISKTTQSTGAMRETSNYGDLDEVAPPGKEDWIKSNKDRFKKQYGDKKGTNILYATAWADYNKKHGKK